VDPRRVDCLGFFFMALDALIYFSHSQGSHACQLALSCDAVVLFERAPDLVSKLSIFSCGQSLCDLIRPRCRVDPASTLWVEIQQLPDLEFVFGHDRVRLYGSLDQFDRLDDRGIVVFLACGLLACDRLFRCSKNPASRQREKLSRNNGSMPQPIKYRWSTRRPARYCSGRSTPGLWFPAHAGVQRWSAQCQS